jgi:UDPglucose--hexose-1-phosphate uridylyltransferase
MTGTGRIRADVLRATESLYGPSRFARPKDIDGAAVTCPFCPGNEHLTGALLTTDPGPAWGSRVVANLYPAVTEPDGRHEVIIETRDHAAAWPTLGPGEIERILHVYRERERAAYADGHAFATVFKNSGSAAGASLRHPHAQVVALRAIPRSIAARLARLTDDCAVCALQQTAPNSIVVESNDLVAYVPQGSRTAFEVRIAPRRHADRFSETSAAFTARVAAVLDDVLKRLVTTLGEELPFNIVVQSAPQDRLARARVHWEIEVVPRLENFGGYELSTGGFLVSRLPEDAAGVLRHAGSPVCA